MEPRPYSVTVDRTQALVFRENVLVSRGRWTGSSIENLTDPLVPGAPEEEAAILAALAKDLAEEERARVALGRQAHERAAR
jgi:hypothetical protein